jgi:hypothetical protein
MTKLAKFQSFRVSEFQGYRVSEFQNYRVTELQSYRITGLKSYRITGLKSFRLTKLKSFRVKEFQSYRVTGLHLITNTLSKYRSGAVGWDFRCKNLQDCPVKPFGGIRHVVSIPMIHLMKS